MVLLPDDSLLISSMDSSRKLYHFDTARQVLTALTVDLTPPAERERWGEADCPAPELMLSHGLDLAQRLDDGSWQLLVVNHHERESIEFFEVRDSRAGDPPVLRWRGCVMAAPNAQFNDVAALPDGGFLATDPITASWQLLRMLMGSVGMDTGRVYRWSPDSGYRAVPHTEGAYPNGILLSADGESFYLNLYLDGEVRKHDLETGEVLARVAVDKPDNSALGSDGTLLVASHRAPVMAMLAAVGSGAGERNTIPFDIVAIDPDEFSASVRFRSDGTAMGGGTVAQQVGNQLYIGAFRGDRFLRVTLNR
jgi:hypothetical protein